MTTIAAKRPPDLPQRWITECLQRRRRGRIASSMNCLSETSAAMFVDHRLSAEQAVEVEIHMDACECCRELIAALARTPART
jgi:hypothetical protein